MIPKAGMLHLDDYAPDVTLALLDKTTTDKNMLHNDIYSLDIICNDDQADMPEEPSARTLLKLPSHSNSSSNDLQPDIVVDSDEITHLKIVNHKFFSIE